MGPRRLRRFADDCESRPYELFRLVPCSPVIGAEIFGVDLSRPTPELLSELHRALLEWKVLFFADQHLTADQHVKLASNWGGVEPSPFLPTIEHGISRLTKDSQSPGNENVWHTDLSFLAQPPFGSILRAVEVPPVGGDTVWSDMAAAYDNLPSDIQAEIQDLRAVHTWERAWKSEVSPARAAQLEREAPPVEHPVVRIHPETGRQTLFVNHTYTDRIPGVDCERSSWLLKMLSAQASVPEYQTRFRWKAGSVAFWDNRAVQHYAVSDYYPERRVMERVAIAGPGAKLWEIAS